MFFYEISVPRAPEYYIGVVSNFCRKFAEIFANECSKLLSGINDTDDKFIVGVVDNGDKNSAACISLPTTENEKLAKMQFIGVKVPLTKLLTKDEKTYYFLNLFPLSSTVDEHSCANISANFRTSLKRPLRGNLIHEKKL